MDEACSQTLGSKPEIQGTLKKPWLWLSSPRQKTGMSVDDYVVQFTDWKERKESLIFSVDEEYIEDDVYRIARIEDAMMSIESNLGTRHMHTQAPNMFDKMPDPILGAESENQHDSVVTDRENIEYFDRENKDGLGGEDGEIDLDVQCDDKLKLGEDNTQNDEICGLSEPSLHLLVSATQVPLEVEAQKSFDEMPALISTAVIEDHKMPIDVDGKESMSPSYSFGSEHDFSMKLKEEKLHRGEIYDQIYGLLEDGLYIVIEQGGIHRRKQHLLEEKEDYNAAESICSKSKAVGGEVNITYADSQHSYVFSLRDLTQVVYSYKNSLSLDEVEQMPQCVDGVYVVGFGIDWM